MIKDKEILELGWQKVIRYDFNLNQEVETFEYIGRNKANIWLFFKNKKVIIIDITTLLCGNPFESDTLFQGYLESKYDLLVLMNLLKLSPKRKLLKFKI